MTHANDFDDLYRDVRDRLLAEAYALTGDLHVSRTAVRDALAVAWHHWHKVQHLPDQEAWLRPLVWSRARHRHSARPWHKEKGVPTEVVSTLDALATLDLPQRKALVLTHLTPLSQPDAAREIGVPPSVAAQLVAEGTRRFAEARESSPDEVGDHLRGLAAAVAGGRWPRSTILRRAGTARRRTYTALGVAATVVAVVTSGMVVAQGDSVDATLGQQGFERRATQVEAEETAPTLSDEVLLSAPQVRRLGRGLEWTESAAHGNQEGDGLVLPCQQDRYAGPAPLAALVRDFSASDRPARGGGKNKKKNTNKKAEESASAVQSVELAASPEEAAEAFGTAQAWVAGCAMPRTQLLAVHDLPGVGDEARVFTLRRWAGPTRTVHVALARTGQLLVATAANVGGLRPAPGPAASVLAAAVNATCGTPGAGECASPPKPRVTAVPSTGVVPGLLSEVDLPPVAGAVGPWVGTSPEPADVNVAATRCDRTSFQGKGLQGGVTRTYLFPRGKRADEFGVTESAARSRNPKVGRAFVAQVRNRVAQCAQEGFGTEVERLVHRESKKVDLTVWRLELAISDQASVEFLMAIMRHGKTVAQVGFTPARGRTMARDDFTWLSRRALERLPRLTLE